MKILGIETASRNYIFLLGIVAFFGLFFMAEHNTFSNPFVCLTFLYFWAIIIYWLLNGITFLLFGKAREKRSVFSQKIWVRVLSSISFYVLSLGFVVLALSLPNFLRLALQTSPFYRALFYPVEFLATISLVSVEIIGYCSFANSQFSIFSLVLFLTQWSSVIATSCWLSKNKSFKVYLAYFCFFASLMILSTYFILEKLGSQFKFDGPWLGITQIC